MTSHLLIFTIGPAQSFIAQARKTHDLFAGSALLNHLCAVGIDETIKAFEDDHSLIITPKVSLDATGNVVRYQDGNLKGFIEHDFLLNRL